MHTWRMGCKLNGQTLVDERDGCLYHFDGYSSPEIDCFHFSPSPSPKVVRWDGIPAPFHVDCSTFPIQQQEVFAGVYVYRFSVTTRQLIRSREGRIVLLDAGRLYILS